MVKILLSCLFLVLFNLQINGSNLDKETSVQSYTDNKIEAIANLYGHARYFYPNKYTEKLNGYKFLMHTLRESKNIEDNPDSLSVFLYRSFSPLIPEMQLVSTNQTYGIKGGSTPDRSTQKSFYVMEHYGLGGGNVFGLKMPFHSKIVEKSFSSELPFPDSLYSYPVCSGITLRYPISLSRLDPSLKKQVQQLINRIDTIDLRITNSVMKSLMKNKNVSHPILNQDEALRIADIIVHWNVMKLFYPYLEEDGLAPNEMNLLLQTYWKKAAQSDNFKQYYFFVLREFMGYFNDQHIVLSSDFSGEGMVGGYINTENNSIGLEYIDGRVVSQYNFETSSGKSVKRGDALITLNDVPVELLLKEQVKYVSAATPSAKIQQTLVHGFKTLKTDSIFTYTFKNQSGDTIHHPLATNKQTSNGFTTGVKPKSREFIQDLGNGIFYLLLSSKDCSVKLFEQFLNKAPDIQSLILELREYPSGDALELLGYLSDKPIVWGDYRDPIRYFPDQDKAIWKSETDTIPSRLPRIKAPVYALINQKTISYGESMANILKKYKLATLVGSNTSGTNGTMANAGIRLFSFTFSVGKDFDGYHGIGVTPDIEVHQTIENYKEGIDTVLEETKNRIINTKFQK